MDYFNPPHILQRKAPRPTPPRRFQPFVWSCAIAPPCGRAWDTALQVGQREIFLLVSSLTAIATTSSARSEEVVRHATYNFWSGVSLPDGKGISESTSVDEGTSSSVEVALLEPNSIDAPKSPKKLLCMKLRCPCVKVASPSWCPAAWTARRLSMNLEMSMQLTLHDSSMTGTRRVNQMLTRR